MIKDRIGKILPEIFIDFLPRIFVGRFAQLLAKHFIRLVPAGETDYNPPRRQTPLCSQIIESRNQFAMRQVTGCSKNNDRARLRSSSRNQALPQWIRKRLFCHNLPSPISGKVSSVGFACMTNEKRELILGKRGLRNAECW